MIEEYPPNSPDMNPIENLLQILKISVSKRKPTNLANLERIIMEEWTKIGNNKTLLENLARSMPDRIEELREAKGLYTTY